jgi:hypothetical protein
MVEYYGVAVDTAAAVDQVTADRINGLTGGIENEMKMHRRTIRALAALMAPRLYTQAEITQANKAADQAQRIDRIIEGMVLEGKEFKITHGLA